MRAIDADALQAEYKKSHDGKRLLLIDVAPTIEPDPQWKRGQWLDSYKRQTCSLCKGRGFKSWNYCPYCGAMMKETNKAD